LFSNIAQNRKYQEKQFINMSDQDQQIYQTLQDLLPTKSNPSLSTSVIPSLLQSVQRVAETLRSSHQISQAGTANAFGDDQLNVDVQAENIIREALASCPAVVTASSEEDPKEVPASSGSNAPPNDSGEEYTVAFDPLDGSSIIAPNWTVGAIIGIWEGSSALNQSPAKKQVASILGVFGPRTTAIVAWRLNDISLCFEVGLSSTSCELVRPSVTFASPPFKTRYFAPANLRAAAEDERYSALISKYISEKYTLRYSGGLVPDVVHALVKGHGVYVSPVTEASKAKLRRLYELAPLALLVECAGGRAVDPATGRDVLATEIGDCDERGGLICGTREEVERVCEAFGF
jgi:sedoheptulose-bisphosphatase